MDIERKLELEEPLLAVGDEEEEELEAGGGLATRRRSEKGGRGGVKEALSEVIEEEGTGPGDGSEEEGTSSGDGSEDEGTSPGDGSKVKVNGGDHQRSVYFDQDDGTGSNGAARGIADFALYGTTTRAATEIPPPENGNFQSIATFSTNAEAFYTNGKENKSDTDDHRHAQISDKDKQPSLAMDVERVLEEQDTHELYCPNCNSCITKRVILRKRKRTIREKVRLDSKRERIQPIQTNIVVSPDIIETTDEHHDQEPDVFRCLSCFSFFISTDGGFKLFRIFGKRSESESPEAAQPGSEKGSNWMTSCFEFIGGKKDNGSVKSELKDDKETGDSETIHGEESSDINNKGSIVGGHGSTQRQKGDFISHESRPLVIHDSRADQKEKEELVENDKPGITQYMEQNDNNSFSRLMTSRGTEDQSKSNSQTEIKENEKSETEPYKSSENEKSPAIGKPSTSLSDDWLQEETANKAVPNDVLIASNENNILPDNAEFDMKGKLHTGLKTDIEGGGIFSLLNDASKSTQQIVKGPTSEQPIPVPRPPTYYPRDDTQLIIEEGITTETRGRREWDILKAIVYGGLIEAITSLGVISSASGGDASTLNIVALGLANLIGGFLLIIHNLFDLRDEQYDPVGDTDEQAGSYWNLLGRRGHFTRHMTAALISFVVAGTLPPAIYGFTFQKSDNKEYKLIAVAAASLTYIGLLALAKAHVQTSSKPYFKNLLYYLSLGVSASGLSYVAGVFIHRLLVQLGLFDNGSAAPPVQGLELAAISPQWTSWY